VKEKPDKKKGREARSAEKWKSLIEKGTLESRGGDEGGGGRIRKKKNYKGKFRNSIQDRTRKKRPLGGEIEEAMRGVNVLEKGKKRVNVGDRNGRGREW